MVLNVGEKLPVNKVPVVRKTVLVGVGVFVDKSIVLSPRTIKQ